MNTNELLKVQAHLDLAASHVAKAKAILDRVNGRTPLDPCHHIWRYDGETKEYRCRRCGRTEQEQI